MAARRPLLAQLLALNVLLSGLVLVAQADTARAGHPLVPPTDCPPETRLPTALAVHGAGKVLVRWWGSQAHPMPMAEVDGFRPYVRVQRSVDGGPFAVVEAQLTRAPTAAEALARLTAAGGDDTALLVDTAKGLDPGFGEGTDAPYAGQVLLDALAFFEAPAQDMARSTLADRAWRVAWALGLGWVDTGVGPADVNHLLQYRIAYAGAAGASPQPMATTQAFPFQNAPQAMAAPTGVVASSIDDLPGAPETLGPGDAGDWGAVQRRRWVDGAVAVRWDLPAPPAAPCAQTAEQNALPPDAAFPAGYDVYRRPNCTVPNPMPSDPCKQHTRVNAHPVFPAAPEHEYAGSQNNDSAHHVAFEAFFVDRAGQGLQVGKQYCYLAVARNLLGDTGLKSGEDCAWALETVPPEAPRDFRVGLEGNKPKLTWGIPRDAEGKPEAVSRFEVWRTHLLRQDLLPAPGDPPNPHGKAEHRWKLHATVVPSGGATGFTWYDFDPALKPGEHRWYKVRAFDVPPKGATFVANGATKPFQGNPSAFTPPLSTGPEDLTGPQRCPGEHLDKTYGDYQPPVGGAPLPGGAKVDPGCRPVHLPKPNDLVASAPGGGCIEYPLPLHPDLRRIYWFQGDDATPDRLHLTRVFANEGQTALCNPLGLEWPMDICVKLQGEDAVGNRGAMYPLLPGQCYYPSFSANPVPPPPTPVITEVEPKPGNKVVVRWQSTSPAWLQGFHVLQHLDADLTPDAPGCPDPLPAPGALLGPAAREATVTLAQTVVYFTVAAKSTVGATACSEPFAHQKGSTLPWAHHTSKFLPLTVGWSGGGADLSWGGASWGGASCGGAGPKAPYYVVHRSLRQDQGFVAITPPIQGCRYSDTSAPDARYYYQVSMVGHGKDTLGAIVDGEVHAVSSVVQAAGPKPAWPATPSGSHFCPLAPIGSQKTIEELYFGDGARRQTIRVCWHKEDPASTQLAADALEGLVSQLGQGPGPDPAIDGLLPPGVGPVPNPVPVVPAPVATPLTLSGAGFLLLDLPKVGARGYLLNFSGLTVLPSTPLCCLNPGVTAKVLAGKVTQADVPGCGKTKPQPPGCLFPFHVGAEVGPSDPPLYRYRLENLTLDREGANAQVVVRLPADVRLRVPVGTTTDDLNLGTANLTRKLEFKKDFALPFGPGQCAGSPSLWFELTTLPLRLVPDTGFQLTQAAMSPVTWCAAYRDPYVAGHPQGPWPPRPPPSSPYHVNANDAFLDGAWTGTGRVDPRGAMASLARTGSLAWVAAAPMGFRVQGEGATLSIVGGRIHAGAIQGPVSVQATYRTDTAGPVFGGAEREEVAASFPAGLAILDGGAMLGTGGSLASADAARVPWLNGAFDLQGLSEPAWQLHLGPVQAKGRLMAGDATDDDAAGDLLGPHSKSATQLVGPGLNYLLEGAPKKMTWACLEDLSNTLVLDTAKIAINLRQSGFHQQVKADIDANDPIEFKLYGYETALLNFHGTFLDSRLHTSDVRLRVTIPEPGDFSFLLLQVVLDPSTGCVESGAVPPGTLVTAQAWGVELAPQLVEFRDAGTKKVLWALGWGDLPHLAGPHPPKEVPAGFVPFDVAWSPAGQATDGFAPHPQLRLDGFNFTATKLRFGRALDVPPCSGVDCQAVAVDEDEQPGAGWAKGTLGAAPCAGTDPGAPAQRAGRCPPFLRYEGHLVLPYWGQSQGTVQATAFAPGARHQLASGKPGAAMEGTTHVGFAAPVTMQRGWTEASGVAGTTVDVLYARQPGDAEDRGLFAGFARDQDFGDTSIMNAATVASTLVPCTSGTCLKGDPDVQVLTGMAASPGVLRAVATALWPAHANAPDLEKELEPGVQAMLGQDAAGKDMLRIRDLQALLVLWDDFGDGGDCTAQPTCYLQAKDVLNARLDAFQGDLPAGHGGGAQAATAPPKDGGIPDFLADLATEGGHETELIEEWDIGIGEMRATIFWTTNALGDYTFERLEAEVKLDERSDNNFLTAESVKLTIDRHGVVLIEGHGLKSRVLEFAPKSADLTLRFEKSEHETRFDGGLSIKDWKLGTLVILSAHAVFGAGETDTDPDPNVVAVDTYFYLGFAGEGYSEQDQTTVAMAFLVGSIDPTSMGILKQHGFADLIAFFEAGEAGTMELRGAYLRAYASVPIYNNGCFAQLNAGMEAAFWYFDGAPGDGAHLAVFGGKYRMFLTGTVLCLVSARGDVSLSVQDVTNVNPALITDPDELLEALLHQHHSLTFVGHGWAAAGVGFCDAASWTNWNDRFWGDDWCAICGFSITITAKMEVFLNLDPADFSIDVTPIPPDTDVAFDADCGLG